MRGHLNHSVVYNHVAAARTVEKSTGMEMKSGSGNTNPFKNSPPTLRLHLFSSFSAPLLLSLHLTLVRCGERKGGPEKVEKERVLWGIFFRTSWRAVCGGVTRSHGPLPFLGGLGQ